MVDPPLEPLSPSELAEIDARYEPFPAFRDWPKEVPKAELWAADLERFTAVSAQASQDDLQKAQEIALRAAAFDTGAIEGLYPTDRGLTFTVATQATAWEQQVAERDTGALDLFRAQLAAFELVLDLATDRVPQITQALIRRLHEEVTAAQATYVVHTPVGVQEQPLQHGQYKRHPNHVRTAVGAIHAYAPVESTQTEMQRFVDELASAEFQDAHPLLQAAYAHYVLAAIHPFADGNGRVARAVASAYTYRAASIPLLVLAHQRERYLSALAAADAGEAARFVEFTAEAARGALELVTESLKAAQAPQPAQLLDELRDVYVAHGELSYPQMDAIATAFAESLLEVIAGLVDSLSVPDGITISWENRVKENPRAAPPGFRSPIEPGPRYVELMVRAAPPVRGGEISALDIFLSTDSDTSTTLMLSHTGYEEDQLIFGLADLQPQLSSAARLRLESFVQRIIGESLQGIVERFKDRRSHSELD